MESKNQKMLMVIVELDGGLMPTKGTKGSACYDLYYNGPAVVLYPNQQHKFDLGIKLQLPDNYEAQLRTRSSFSKAGLHVYPGTIDSDYRKELSVIIRNNGNPYEIGPGDRIAQMKISQVPKVELVSGQVEETGRGGFGSTGK